MKNLSNKYTQHVLRNHKLMIYIWRRHIPKRLVKSSKYNQYSKHLKPLLKHIYEKACNEKVNSEKHQKLYTFTERSEQNNYTKTKTKITFTFKKRQKINILIFKFYKSKLGNTFLFYVKSSFSFDNNVLKLFQIKWFKTYFECK